MEEVPSSTLPPKNTSTLKQIILLKWNAASKKKKIIYLSIPVLLLLFGLSLVIKLTVLQKHFPDNPESHNQLPQDTGSYEKLIIPQRKTSFFVLNAKTTSKYGILPTEEFILKTQKIVTDDFIKNNLQTSAPVTVDRQDDTTFIIKPDNAIAKDSVYEIKLLTKDKENNGNGFDRNYGWAFQTQGKFRVVSSIPGNKKTNVPTNTGIEITFSQDGYEDPKSYISISPHVNYRLEYHAETLAIVPNEKLSEATVYTVMLKKGLNLKSRNDPLSEDLIFSFQTEVEKTQNSKPRFTIAKNLQQIATTEKAEFKVYTFDWDNSKVQASIYQFPDSASFITSRKVPDESYKNWYSYYPENVSIDLTKLSLVSKTDLAIETQNDVKFIRLPAALPAGYYLIQVEYGEKKNKEYVWLQSTGLSGFVAGGTKKTTVWINSLKDGKPQSNASVQMGGSGTVGSTNDQGISTFDTPQNALNQPGTYIKLIKDGEELVLPFYTGNQQAKRSQNDYWTYLYHERNLYKTDDTIYFWGIVKDRDTGRIPPQIKISISKSEYYYGSGDSGYADFKSILVTPESDGTFIGSIPYTDLPPSWYNLRVETEGITVISSGFSVENYTKPDLKIDVTSKKKAVFAGESVNFKAQVAFFDNTPVSGISLKTFEKYGVNPSERKTDKKGELEYSLKPVYDSYSLYSYACVTFAPAAAAEKTVEGNGCVLSFNNRLILNSNSSQESSQANFRVSANLVDLDKYNKNPSQGFTGKPATGQKGDFSVYKYWYEKIPAGTYYDFIEKITRPRYEYKRHEEEVTKTTLTSNDSGNFTNSFPLDEDKSYRVALSVTDSDGHKQEVTEYFYAYNRHEDISVENISPELILNKKENIYALGETVQLKIQSGNKLYTDTENNNFLFILSSRGTQEVFFSDSPQLAFPFGEKHLPNSFASAVIFTGKTYSIAQSSCIWEWQCVYGSNYYDYSLPAVNFAYKKEDRELKFDISYNKKSYQPGEEAEITVTVKGSDDKPKDNTQVQLTLVDEAMEAIGGVNLPSSLSSLYKNIESGIFFSYYSHQSVYPDESGAEKGGGGGGDERNIFKDTAFFKQARTNTDGKAVFKVQLPDNITSWVVFTQAFNQNLETGHTRSNLVSTKDFFVFPAFMSKVLTGDKPKLVGRSYGEAVNESSPVSYSVQFKKDETVIKNLVKNGKAFSPVTFEFPKLSTGNYTLALHGSAAGKKDAVSLPFSVIESRFAFEKQDKIVLQKGSKFKAPNLGNIQKDKPVTLLISDGGKGIYYDDLFNRCSQGSNRIEKILSGYKAKQILVDLYDDKECINTTESLKKYQTESGGVSLVMWGAADLPASAWSASVDHKLFSQEKLVNYFERELQDTKNDRLRKIYAAWGLQSSGKPMLTVLNQYAQESVTIMEKTISGIALAQNGETETARNLYYDILAEYAYISKPYIRIQSGKTTIDDLVKNSSLVLLLGSLVEPEYNEGLYLYIRDYKYDTQDIVLDLAEITFIGNQLAKLPKDSTEITFSSSVRTLPKKFDKETTWRLKLAKEELNNFTVTVLRGKAEVLLNYSLGLDAFSRYPKDKRLSLSKTYTNMTGSDSTFNPGDIIRVNLSFDFSLNDSPRGQHTITDILPSGLVFIENPSLYTYNLDDWVQSAQDNKIVFSVYNDLWWLKHNDKNLTYYARVAGSGTYREEPTLFQSKLDASVLTYTDIKTFVSN